MHYIECDELKRYASLRFLMSVRNIFTVPELKGRICELFGCDPGALVTVSQVHGNISEEIDDEYLAEYRRCSHSKPPDADAMITEIKNTPLGIFTADCLPILLYAPGKGVISLIHAGKAGTAAQAALLTAEKMMLLHEVKPDEITAVIGPSIGPCCYEADLWSENERQLKSAGISRIINPRLCTACHTETFFSYRREKGTPGRMITAAMLL
jgi:hypothetical protein